MKTIAALLVFGVLALALAGASGAQSGAKPPFGVPDPARLVLRSTDLGGARVVGQGYYHDDGFVSSYARAFSAPRVAGTPTTHLESDVEVASTGPDARTYVVGFRQFASTRTGRAELKKMLTSADTSGVVLTHVVVDAPRPLTGTNGSDVAVTFKLLGLPAEAHLAVFSQGRFLGELMVLGIGGRPLTRAAVAHVARIMTSRFAAAVPPTNVAAPTISGTAAVGQTLTASPGTWTKGPTRFGFQWGRCNASSCTDIAGANGPTYVPTASDAGFTLRVWVTATNANGSRNAVSAATDPVLAPPTNLEPPVVTGSPVVGQILTATTGSWEPIPTSYSFGWKLCDAAGTSCAAVGGDLQSYTPGPTDVGSRLVAVITARNAAGSTTIESAPTPVITGTS
jgi:hypothetical protein